jgi:hypothetical protein
MEASLYSYIRIYLYICLNLSPLYNKYTQYNIHTRTNIALYTYIRIYLHIYIHTSLSSRKTLGELNVGLAVHVAGASQSLEHAGQAEGRRRMENRRRRHAGCSSNPRIHLFGTRPHLHRSCSK